MSQRIRLRARVDVVSALLAAACVVLSSCRIEAVESGDSPADEEPDLEAQIASILEEQAAAWNAGYLDGFLAAYERSPATTYIGSGGLRRGFDAIRDRYAPLFAPGAERDSLRFGDVAVRELDPRFAVVTARYTLHREDEVTSTGPFTLVLMRVEGAWKIVHDQSAADPPPD